MNTTWQDTKARIIAECAGKEPCNEQCSRFQRAKSERGMWTVICDNLQWLIQNDIDPGPMPAGFTHCGGYLCLNGYEHPLPAGFTHCGAHLDLRGYEHPLPAEFTHCGAHLDLSGYEHPLPAEFTHCGGSLYLSGYEHPLPAGFKSSY